MNFQNDYNSFYTSYYNKIEKLVKHFLVAEKSKSKKVDIVLNSLTEYLFSTIPNRFEVVGNENLKKLLQLFEKRNTLYESNQINLIFTNDIKRMFDSIDPLKLPAKYNLKKLVIEIAIVTAINDIAYLLNLNRSLFVLFYHLNDFSMFEVKQYKEMSIEDTPLYLELIVRVYPDYLTTRENSGFLIPNDEQEENTKPYSLPFAIALLNAIGFFELEKIKNLTPSSLAKIIAIIQQKDPSNKTTIRSISGNIRVLNPNNKEDNFKYTSHKHVEKVKTLLNEIKLGE